MERFAQLYLELDQSNRNSEKLEALTRYFQTAPAEDAIWVVYILAGRKLGRTINSRQLREWVGEISGYADWLVQECYGVVGDLSETLSLLIPFAEPVRLPPAAAAEAGAGGPVAEGPSLHEVIERLRAIGKMEGPQQREMVLKTWRELTVRERFVFHKLISGNFRVGISERSLVLALAAAAGVEPAVIAQRLTGKWVADARKMEQLLKPSSADERTEESLPYPFMLAHALNDPLETLGSPADWHVEWKWDGIRAQMLVRRGKVDLWSRGDEHITSAFPELVQAGEALPEGTVVDGEIVAWDEVTGRPKPFLVLQKRINRKNVELSFWPDVLIKFVAFDVLELGGRDLRAVPLGERREMLRELLAGKAGMISLSEPIVFSEWGQLTPVMAESRDRNVEGVMLKRRDSAYVVGRPTGLWWKLKVNPYTVDAVLIGAQPGTGRRAGLLTDYTFGVWNEGRTELVPVAKAYSGLTDAEIAEMDKWVRRNTTGRFGPVHAVKPVRVFELGFEAIQRSDRHKAGIAVRFPRILRVREDKKPEEADELVMLEELLRSVEAKS